MTIAKITLLYPDKKTVLTRAKTKLFQLDNKAKQLSK